MSRQPPKDLESPLSVLARQQTFNRRTRANTNLFEPHRQRVTGAIVAASRDPAGRLCVLGAGNANDLDLPVLARAFEQIHLVDLDPEALQQAIERHRELDPVLRLHSGVDLSGIATQLDDLDHPPRADQLDELITAAGNVPAPELPEPYNNLAVLYAARGDHDGARDALLRAISTHPSYATAHENLGDI